MPESPRAGATAPEAAAEDATKLSPEAFRMAFRNHPAGVAVITSDDGTGPVAMTATSVISVSATPPLIVFSASAMSSSTPTLRRSSSVVVHLLTADELPLAQRAATSGIDRFAGIAWHQLSTGEPVFTEASMWLRCRIVDRIDAGMATVFVAEALQVHSAGEEAADRQPLVYQNRTWHRLNAASAVLL
ncbi:flavin reductase family protein [Herbiconiux sp. CPCC 203407]|uniref:Flavin reductase family protein n=1 Tax=Herbiconiux oxytropis TaxID=2970915 RepID=A0AA41XFB6_9MICO|nr:flavin reductase family protein [Herbiconiux oxytropis]MCS5721576.1 flavin reductase family protein [Herbiconiux oxytropis]MCS5724653.1 flavin reductase family protein [Herbiconiux oxytropis]